MTYTQAVILGIVQGVSEFLPVSSSGHLVLVQRYFQLTESMINFDIFVHFGTLLAVFVVFRGRIAGLVAGLADDARDIASGRSAPLERLRRSPYVRTTAAILIGTIPAGVVGITMKDGIETLFSSVLPVLGALAFTGIMLIATFFVRRGDHEIGPGRGLFIGVAQALAIIPGVSRSGSTISTALFLGAGREQAG